ncbi:MAG: hypothetical protein PHY30_01770 [Candidatus Pacebacteria bacterium]|nr:hypothetical protein [Candidatus Paceibacterota bacterium]
MEDQTRNKIILTCLVCAIMAFGVFFVLNENQKILENKASVVDLYNGELKKVEYNIDGQIVGTYIDPKTGNIVSEEGEVDSTEVISKTIAYLDEYFEGDNTVSLKKVEEDKDSSLYKLQFQIGDQLTEFYVTKNGEKIFMGDVLNMDDNELLNGFSEKSIDIKLIDNKVPVYFYGVSYDSHSTWEYDVLNQIKAKFGNDIVVYDYMDSDENEDYFFDYSDGSMPLLVIADKYFRVGSGEKVGKEADINAISSIICGIQNLDACK